MKVVQFKDWLSVFYYLTLCTWAIKQHTLLLEINDVKLPLTVTRSQRGPHFQVIDNNNMSIIKLHYGFDKMSCLFACLYFPEII